MSGSIGFVVALPVLLAGAAAVAAVALGALTVGAVGYGLVKGIQELMETSRTTPVNKSLPQHLAEVREGVGKETQQQLASIELHQQQSAAILNDLQSELGTIERQVQQRLQDNHQEFVRMMQQQQQQTQQQLEQQYKEFLGRLNSHREDTSQQLQHQRGEYPRLFEKQDQRFAERIKREQQYRQEAVEQLQNQLNSIIADANKKIATARSFVADLQKIQQDTNNIPHQRFAPGQMDRISRHIQDAGLSVESGMAEAALSTAQQAYWDLVDLRVLVNQKEQEFILLHQTALQEVRSLLEEARLSRHYQMEVGDDGEREVSELDVDYWSRGELTAHEESIESLLKRVTEDEKTLTVEGVKRILQEIDRLKPKCGEIIEHAKLGIIASQLRNNLGELAVMALQEHGFELIDSAYECDDERNAFTVKVRNLTGGEVVTVIAPIEGDHGKNAITVNSYDETFVDEATMQQRAQEIIAILGQEGLLMSEPKCHGQAQPEYQDITAVRQRKVTMARH